MPVAYGNSYIESVLGGLSIKHRLIGCFRSNYTVSASISLEQLIILLGILIDWLMASVVLKK